MTNRTAPIAAAALALLLTPIVGAQVAAEANKGYQTKEGRARVAGGLDSPEREKRQKPRELIAAIGIDEGDVVCDMGTGVGFMIPYFLDAVGAEGKVYAEDIQQDFLDKVKAKKAERDWKNVELVLGGQKDPELPDGACDIVFILDAYHHFTFPVETMRNVARALKPEARLVVVDFYRSRKHPRMSEERLKGHIRLDRDGFAAEIESAGFKLERQFDHLPHQYALIFLKKG